MKVVSQSAALTQIVCSLDLETSIVGVGPADPFTPKAGNVTKGTKAPPVKEPKAVSEYFDLDLLKNTKPDLVLFESFDLWDDRRLKEANEFLILSLGVVPRLVPIKLRTLNDIYEAFPKIGKATRTDARALSLINRMKAQILDWASNFYERTKNKKVTVLSSIAPVTLAGFWVPELIKLSSSEPQFGGIGEPDFETSWDTIKTFRPDVIVVAPRGKNLEECTKSFKVLEREKVWEELPAVKRGEVIFMDGNSLYQPNYDIIDGIAILISAIAGLESGYITPRNSFVRLRWLELHRHRV